jgi:hypothetical protein
MVAVRYLLVAHIPPEGVPDFLAYESSTLALLPEHGATLEHRFRSCDGCLEVHVLRFPSADALASYRSDPRRSALTPILERSGATTALHPLDESGSVRTAAEPMP